MTENPRHSTNNDPALAAARERGHEDEGLFVRRIVATAVSLFVLAVVSLGTIALIMRSKSNPDASPVASAEEWRSRPSDPGVTPDQTAMRENAERQMQQQLTSYGWQDADHHVARIPIDRAMRLLAEKNMHVSFEPSDTEPSDTAPSDDTPDGATGSSGEATR